MDKIVAGYIGIKIDTPGTVQVCHKCSTVSLQELRAHSFGAVFTDDVYLTRNGGLVCVLCQEKFI